MPKRKSQAGCLCSTQGNLEELFAVQMLADTSSIFFGFIHHLRATWNRSNTVSKCWHIGHGFCLRRLGYRSLVSLVKRLQNKVQLALIYGSVLCGDMISASHSSAKFVLEFSSLKTRNFNEGEKCKSHAHKDEGFTSQVLPTLKLCL